MFSRSASSNSARVGGRAARGSTVTATRPLYSEPPRDRAALDANRTTGRAIVHAMACPFCHQPATAFPVGFTWWGGVLGPKLLHHAKCSACGRAYNAKTGKSNTTGIVIYSVVVGAIVLALMLAVLPRLLR